MKEIYSEDTINEFRRRGYCEWEISSGIAEQMEDDSRWKTSQYDLKHLPFKKTNKRLSLNPIDQNVHYKKVNFSKYF